MFWEKLYKEIYFLCYKKTLSRQAHMKAAVILGAGFSKNSGIPVQSEIPQYLVGNDEDNEFERAVSSILEKYMKNVFGYSGSTEYPALDDMFTCLDLSTNSGHHLGLSYSPFHLRAVRRFLVYRVFRILRTFFKYSDDVNALISKLENKFSDIGYVVLNWDTVLESYLLSQASTPLSIDYCCGGERWGKRDYAPVHRCIKVAKIHGSSNWLYCDNCRTLFYDMDNEVSLEAMAGFQATDFLLFDEFNSVRDAEIPVYAQKCRLCGDYVSSHIATFSYRKSFRTNSFPNIWNEMEKLLSSSDKWIFIGYSLPDPDYEFKHLLKISQLKMEHLKPDKLSIDVVLLDSDATILKYRKFFGNSIKRIYNRGIKEYINKVE